MSSSKNNDDDNNHHNQQIRNLLKMLQSDEHLMESIEEDPIFIKGHEEGQIAGYEIASQNFKEELRSLQTIVNALIETK